MAENTKKNEHVVPVELSEEEKHRAIEVAFTEVPEEKAPAHAVSWAYQQIENAAHDASVKVDNLDASLAFKKDIDSANSKAKAQLDTATGEFNGKIALIAEARQTDTGIDISDAELRAADTEDEKSESFMHTGVPTPQELADVEKGKQMLTELSSARKNKTMADLVREGAQVAQQVKELRRGPLTPKEQALLDKAFSGKATKAENETAQQTPEDPIAPTSEKEEIKRTTIQGVRATSPELVNLKKGMEKTDEETVRSREAIRAKEEASRQATQERIAAIPEKEEVKRTTLRGERATSPELEGLKRKMKNVDEKTVVSNEAVRTKEEAPLPAKENVAEKAEDEKESTKEALEIKNRRDYQRRKTTESVQTFKAADLAPETKLGKSSFWGALKERLSIEFSDGPEGSIFDPLRLKAYDYLYSWTSRGTEKVQKELLKSNALIANLEEKVAENNKTIEEAKLAGGGLIDAKLEARIIKENNRYEAEIVHQNKEREKIRERFDSYTEKLKGYEAKRDAVCAELMKQTDAELAPFEAKLEQLSLKKEKVLAIISEQTENEKRLKVQLEHFVSIKASKEAINEVKAELKELASTIKGERAELSRLENGYLSIGGRGGFFGIKQYEEIAAGIREYRDSYAKEKNSTAKTTEKMTTELVPPKKERSVSPETLSSKALETEYETHEARDLIHAWNRTISAENDELTLSDIKLSRVVRAKTGDPLPREMTLDTFMDALVIMQEESWSKNPELAAFNRDFTKNRRQYRADIKNKLS